jgi:hypothetical protein
MVGSLGEFKFVGASLKILIGTSLRSLLEASLGDSVGFGIMEYWHHRYLEARETFDHDEARGAD